LYFKHFASLQMNHSMKGIVQSNQLKVIPKLVVFDLDQCLWLPEMYTLDEVPTKTSTIKGTLDTHGDGAVAVMSGRERIRLFPDALTILQEYYLNKYSGMRIAAASSADTPLAVRIGRTAMNLLEVLPGVTMRQVFDKDWPAGFEGHLQIGRTPPLSSDKSRTHFPILTKLTEIEYTDMVFFDDCNWGDHCGKVERECRGVITQRTPEGLTIVEWNKALMKYADTYGEDC